MGLRTPEQYKESLRDGRAVFFRGEKVADVTKHPVIGIAVEHACIDYRMTEDSKYRELAVMRDGGDEYSRYFHLPRNSDDLLKRSQLIAASTREGATLVVLRPRASPSTASASRSTIAIARTTTSRSQ
jgi:aromatic ring hydroxylase